MFFAAGLAVAGMFMALPEAGKTRDVDAGA
jgi:hypothetical protein